MRKLSTQSSPLKRAKTQAGMVIIEALVAILLFSFGILGLIGLQTALIKNSADNKYRSDASYLVQQRVGEIWADPENLSSFEEVDTDVSSTLPKGKRTTTVVNNGASVSNQMVTVEVTWQLPGQDEHNFTTTTYVVAN